MFLNAEDWPVIWLTIWSAALAVALVLPFGLSLAWLLARKCWPGKSLVETLISLPLVLPPVATGLILLKIFGRKGPVGGWLHTNFGIDIVFTKTAVVLALGVMAFPLLVRTLRTAFEEVPRRFEQVARTLGRSAWNTFWTISIPLASRGIASAIVLSFARALGEFGASVMIAGYIEGKTSTLSLSIYQHVQMGDDASALRLLVASLLIAFAALWGSEMLSRRRSLK